MNQSADKKYTYLGVSSVSLDSGQPLAFGDEVTLSPDATRANKRLIETGALVEVTKPSTTTTKKSQGGS